MTRREKVVKSKSRSVDILFFAFSITQLSFFHFSFPFFPIYSKENSSINHLTSDAHLTCVHVRVDVFLNIVPLLDGDDRQYIAR